MRRPGRRRWAAEEKRRIVEETRAPGASVSVVARRHDINANLLFKWKRLEEAGEPDRSLLVGSEFVPIGIVGRTGDDDRRCSPGCPALQTATGRMDRVNREHRWGWRAAAA